MSCVFCAVVAGEAPAIRIYEDDDYLAILDVRPFTRGHTLVIPKRHTVDLTDTPHDTVAAMVRIGQRIARAARQSGLHADGNNVVINDGTAAFQSVLHIHLHVLPRQNGDKLSFAKGISRWLEQNVGAPLLMLHDKLYRATDGRIGHTIPGGPSNLILHTIGAKTGQKRANTLSYARDGDDYLVVASKGGD